jgi:two-component system response regulator VicR
MTKKDKNKIKECTSMKEDLDPNKKTILVVDDEKPIIDILVYNLKKEGYNTLEATDGEMGLNIAIEQRPDLILLDVMLPKMDGLTVCKRVKQTYNVPILMISAKDEEIDKIVGLELGADDYITKPFSVRELMARVKANLRKVDDEKERRDKESTNKNNKIVVGDLELDLEKVEVKVKGQVKALTPKEFELVKYLAMQPGIPVTREVLLEKVWNYEYYGDIRTVDVTVCRIREKLGDSTKNSKIIINKRGIGYYLASK